jgi:hypothetical protein
MDIRYAFTHRIRQPSHYVAKDAIATNTTNTAHTIEAYRIFVNIKNLVLFMQIFKFIVSTLGVSNHCKELVQTRRRRERCLGGIVCKRGG